MISLFYLHELYIYIYFFFQGDCIEFYGQVLVSGDYREGFCERLVEASTMSSRGHASQLQDGHADGLLGMVIMPLW